MLQWRSDGTDEIRYSLITILYRVGQKRGHSTFSRISSNTFSQIGLSSKLQKTIQFLHTSTQGQCRPYSEHAYNIRVYSFYYLKWRHLVNRLPVDNATLKLRHHGVGRRLAYRKDKVVFVEPGGQGLWWEGFMAKGLGLLHPCKMRPIQVDAAARRRACYANVQDSPDGATVWNKVTKPGVNSQYTLAVMCAKTSCKYLWQFSRSAKCRVAEWTRFLWPTQVAYNMIGSSSDKEEVGFSNDIAWVSLSSRFSSPSTACFFESLTLFSVRRSRDRRAAAVLSRSGSCRRCMVISIL